MAADTSILGFKRVNASVMLRYVKMCYRLLLWIVMAFVRMYGRLRKIWVEAKPRLMPRGTRGLKF